MLETSNGPYADINWTTRRALIKDKSGNSIYDKNVTFPDYFTDTAVNITASKYFHKSVEKEEVNLRDMFDRVSNTITDWGKKQKYFATNEEEANFNFKLKYYQVHQMFAFNSPVYFNMGVTDKVQASACFILSIEDNMESIANVGCIESKIFKKGSGSGMNLSGLRSKYENINGQTGYASGCVSFLKVHDTFANVIKSGGSLRRSAKLACLDVVHPDIDEFVDCKKFEEEKLQALKAAGIKARPGCELSDEVFFQSTNLSVQVSDDFMDCVLNNKKWHTRYVTTGKIHKEYDAQDLLYHIAKRTWETGDPALQYSDAINRFNTVSNDGRIRSSNPCGEFLFLDDSACNLVVINLVKFFVYNEESKKYFFKFDLFRDVIETIITAQDIIVDNSVYPTDKITENSKKYRPLGLGYTNLGSLLMLLGLPYDSTEGRNVAALITALMTGVAYQKSNKLATKLGAFERFNDNKTPFYNVLKRHTSALETLYDSINVVKNNDIVSELLSYNEHVWNVDLKKIVDSNGLFRNAQVTLLMPSGTTSFLLDAQTTGVEPEFSHVKYKRLSNTDDGVIKITSDVTKKCLENLGYCDSDIKEIECFITDDKALDLCKCLKKEHRQILHTSNNKNTNQIIHYTGHIKMLAAVQPFISGGISKTVSFPEDCTVEDIYNCYIESWQMGLKGVAIYRDGSKSYQPLSTGKDDEEETEAEEMVAYIEDSIRSGDYKKDDNLIKYMHSILAKRKLPDERAAINHKFSVDRVKGYLTMGMFGDKTLGEVFIKISKEGSTLSGLLDCLATIVSISLQGGIPLRDIVEKMIWQKFEPYGFTENKDIRTATSIVDYIFKYLGMKFLSKEDRMDLGLYKQEDKQEENNDFDDAIAEKTKITRNLNNNFAGSGKICGTCGGITVLKGSCHVCMICGSNDGSCG